MVLIIDLDQTLNCLTPPFRSLLDAVPHEIRVRGDASLWSWISGHLSRVSYPPNASAIRAIRRLRGIAGVTIINTGRPEGSRSVTEKWLKQFVAFDYLFMRADGDCRATWLVKRENCVERIMPLSAGRRVYAFDDNPSAVAMYGELGAIAFRAPGCWQALLAHFQAPDFSDVESALARCAEEMRPPFQRSLDDVSEIR
jgi:hypothetical protein